MASEVSLAEYVFLRLKQLGVGAIHGVPGDYNLTLIDHVIPSGLSWVGNTNELNAAYAADAYARIKGVGALVTTFGVGELSAVNAIAGAFAERAAVVHIVGKPSRKTQGAKAIVHHTLGDGDFRHFSQMHSHVSAVQMNLTNPQTVTRDFDDALRQCLLQSRPVYIEFPMHMVPLQVDAAPLASPIRTPEDLPDSALVKMVTDVLTLVYKAKQPYIFVDGESRSLGILDQVQGLINLTKWPTFTTGFGKGLVDMTMRNVYGIYQGAYADEATRRYIEESDFVLYFGPHPSSTNTYNQTSIPWTSRSVIFSHAGVSVLGSLHQDIPMKTMLLEVLQRLDSSKLERKAPDPPLSRDYSLNFSDVSSQDPLGHDKVWKLLANFLREGDIVLGETGTAAYGVREMPLPRHTRFFTSVTWLSIGYMLPASQGAALAQRELIEASNYHGIKDARTVLFIGDGSLQMTVQELATIIRHNLNVVVFVINNDGYTIERCIHGLKAGYNDISSWRYLSAPQLFGAPETTYTAAAKTYGELGRILGDDKLQNDRGLRMVELFLDRLDAPAGPLAGLLNAQTAPG